MAVHSRNRKINIQIASLKTFNEKYKICMLFFKIVLYRLVLKYKADLGTQNAFPAAQFVVYMSASAFQNYLLNFHKTWRKKKEINIKIQKQVIHLYKKTCNVYTLCGNVIFILH